MSNVHHVTNEIAVLEASIMHLGIGTADANAGYLKNDGTNRSLCLGISPDGTPVVYMTTNGDDAALYDDLDEARNFCRDMGDAEDDDDTRIRDGAKRLLEAVSRVETLYAGNERMMEEMEWYRGKASEVIASLDRD
jgi:hypothetical protein